MMKSVAVDDEPLALGLIETFCKNNNSVLFEKGFTKTAAAFTFIEKNPIDLIFLDINMPAVSGIDFYRSLPYKPLLIFTTSYTEYAIESYELNAVDYLLKPFTPKRFETALNKATQLYKLIHQSAAADDVKYLMLKADYGVIKIKQSEILFIEGLDNYLKIHLLGQSPVVVRITMKALLDKLNTTEFIRVHRSYIIPIHRIESVKQKLISIAGEEIPIGKNYEEALKNYIKDNL